MLPRVAALYRYPVKGFTPESCERLTVLLDGRVAGDRVLGLRFADEPTPDDEWSSKHSMLVLVNTPGLTRLRLQYDEPSLRLRLDLDGALLVDECIEGPGRERIARAVEAYARTLPETPLAGNEAHLPLRLVGDGRTPRYQDSARGEVTLHGRESLFSLAEALGQPDLNERRFRSNVAIEGLEPWQELTWSGRSLRLGEVVFDVRKGCVRCLATHANPETGDRDAAILTTLTRVFGQEEPTFAVSLNARNEGTIALGDALELL